MKKINTKIVALTVSFFALSYTAQAQNKALKIGTNPTIKEASAVLEVESASKGMLMPRVALTSTTDVATITTPAHALTVFNTATAGDVTPGYYYYSKDLVTPANSKWVKLAVAGSAWDLLGNAGTDPATNFLGTTDDKDLRIKVNNGNFGLLTTSTSTYSLSSVFFGKNAGDGLIGTENDEIVALGADAGGKMEKASRSFLAGNAAGYLAKEFIASIAIGTSAGAISKYIGSSILLGDNAGFAADTAANSSFIGTNAGMSSHRIEASNFIGFDAGSSAKNADYSNFIGAQAGANTVGAHNSIFIGKQAGFNDAVSNGYPGTLGGANLSSILIGNKTNTGGFSNSIALGQEAVNTATNQFMIGGTEVYNKIDMVIPNYPATRIDTATTKPTNFLYTDANGKFLSAPIATASATAWNILGNAGTNPATNFLGTTDAKDLKFRVNNEQVAWFPIKGLDLNQSSVFLGYGAGIGADMAYESNFIGLNAGSAAAEANKSNFLGTEAGYNAINASGSNFLGKASGKDATNASNANFFGISSGESATDASYSNFIGSSSGSNATNANHSNFIGGNAGNNATNANNSNFFGSETGFGATNSEYSFFAGYHAGYTATDAGYANFFGTYAGNEATNASYSNFMGNNAGNQATNAASSNFIGDNSGAGATDANKSNFIGYYAGSLATNAKQANFFGSLSGERATNATNSVFIGPYAGNLATNSANSIFIGFEAGKADAVDNTAVTTISGTPTTSILIGQSTSTGGFKNSIAIGAHATNTAENQLMIGDPIFGATEKDFGAVQYDMVNPKYPETRVDTAATRPINFLYTDSTGKFLSAPLSAAIPVISIITKTADYTTLATDETILVDATSGIVKITLPAASSVKGKRYNVKKIDSSVNGVNVVATSGTIDGNAAATGVTGTLPWQGWIFQSDGTNWYILSRI